MAVLNGKLNFSWVQHSHLCIPALTSISANSNWHLATGQTAAPQRLRDEKGDCQ